MYNKNGMKIWEYKKYSFIADDSGLNELGKKGWEAYGIIKDGDCITVLLKRPKYKKDEKK